MTNHWTKFAAIAAATSMATAVAQAEPDRAADRRLRTYANPIDLPYRYQTYGKRHREAADPTLVRFGGRYWLFASHSKGYWYSTNLLDWTFVEPSGFDVNKYAPTVLAMNGKLYLAASEHARKIWVTDDPMSGIWREAADISGYEDPCLFLDTDGRLYMYEGLSGTASLRVLELDPKSFRPIREAAIPQSRGKETRGWEVVGDRNDRLQAPTYIEGSWMTKYRGRYYLQYAGPGTEYKSYADGVLVSASPMGPFMYQPYSPFSFKPTGFIAGAGHGSTLQAPNGKWWHAATMSISRRFLFERRLGLFPAKFARGGELVTDTYLGDYPRYIDGSRDLTGWMLLSRAKPATASSTLDGFPVAQAADEDVRTWWSARTGQPGEWLQLDLGGVKRVEAIQINFADQDSNGSGISKDTYRYIVDGSLDGKSWQVLIDASQNERDSPHDYRVLRRPQHVRYARIRNVHVPDGGKFSLYDLRVFGKGTAALPALVASASGKRDPADPRRATIDWKSAARAEFYIVRLGIRPDLMTQNYQIYDGQTAVEVASLNAGVSYFYAIDAINERGIKRGRTFKLPDQSRSIEAPAIKRRDDRARED